MFHVSFWLDALTLIYDKVLVLHHDLTEILLKVALNIIILSY